MARIPIANATGKAFDRLIEAMRSQLATEITTVQTALNTSVPVPAPAAEAYFRTFSEQARKVVRNQDVAVLLWQQGTSRIVAETVGAGTTYRGTREMDVDVLVVFTYRLASGSPVDAEGYALDVEQELWTRATIYNGAVMNTLCKYGTDFEDGGAKTHRIKPIGDDWELTYADEFLLVGVAQTTYTITQMVDIPSCVPLP